MEEISGSNCKVRPFPWRKQMQDMADDGTVENNSADKATRANEAKTFAAARDERSAVAGPLTAVKGPAVAGRKHTAVVQMTAITATTRNKRREHIRKGLLRFKADAGCNCEKYAIHHSIDVELL
jgi:hypothetical protein